MRLTVKHHKKADLVVDNPIAHALAFQADFVVGAN
jgi:hypothetical protein